MTHGLTWQNNVNTAKCAHYLCFILLVLGCHEGGVRWTHFQIRKSQVWFWHRKVSKKGQIPSIDWRVDGNTRSRDSWMASALKDCDWMVCDFSRYNWLRRETTLESTAHYRKSARNSARNLRFFSLGCVHATMLKNRYFIKLLCWLFYWYWLWSLAEASGNELFRSTWLTIFFFFSGILMDCCIYVKLLFKCCPWIRTKDSLKVLSSLVTSYLWLLYCKFWLILSFLTGGERF